MPELPDTPATPTVSAVSGSTPSLSVSWIAPPNEGRPPIDHYHVQWHVSGATAWNGRDVDAPATTTIISDLTADTEYEVRVRADNAERDSGFSDPPWVGRTNTLTNNAPVFSSSNVALGIAENTAAGVNVGDPVTATDADAGDTLSYTLRGADAEFFDIVDTTGQILTKAGVSYDHEAEDSYTVTVRGLGQRRHRRSQRHHQHHRRGRAARRAGDAGGLGCGRQQYPPVGLLGRPGQRRQARHRQLRRAVPRERRHGLERRPAERHGYDHDRLRPGREHGV